MKIKIYEKFEDILYRQINIKVKRIRISLCRTYLFSKKKDKTLYFRKYVIPRRLVLEAKEKEFKCKGISFEGIDLSKYKMRNINNLLLEYTCLSPEDNEELPKIFDIAKYERKNKVIDSLEKGGVTSMIFDDVEDKTINNMLWINQYNGSNYLYENL